MSIVHLGKRVRDFVIGGLLWGGLSFGVNALFRLGLTPPVAFAVGIIGGMVNSILWAHWERSHADSEPFDD